MKKKREIEEEVKKEKKKDSVESLFSGRTIIAIGVVIFIIYIVYSWFNARMEAMYLASGNVTNPALVGNQIKESFNNSIKKGILLLGGSAIIYYIVTNKESTPELLTTEEAEQIAYEEMIRRCKDTKFNVDLQSKITITATRLQERSVQGKMKPIFYNVGIQVKGTSHNYSYYLVRVYCVGVAKGMIKGVTEIGTKYDGESSPDIKTVVPADYISLRNARDKLEDRYGK